MVKTSGRYNSHLLCLSSLIYLLAAVIAFPKSHALSALIFMVTIFSILHHAKHRNMQLETVDWILGISLTLAALYLFRDFLLVYILLCILIIFRTFDFFVFQVKRYRVYNYSHSVWHLISSLAIVILSILEKT